MPKSVHFLTLMILLIASLGITHNLLEAIPMTIAAFLFVSLGDSFIRQRELKSVVIKDNKKSYSYNNVR